MDNILKADIFFFVATIGVAIITILVAVALLYAIRFLRDARRAAEIVKRETQNISEDVEMIREKLHSSDLSWLSLISIFKNFRNRKGRKRIK